MRRTACKIGKCAAFSPNIRVSYSITYKEYNAVCVFSFNSNYQNSVWLKSEAVSAYLYVG